MCIILPRRRKKKTSETIEQSLKHFEAPAGQIESPSEQIEKPADRYEKPSKEMEKPAEQIKKPSKQTEREVRRNVFPFLSLPFELREMVYARAFLDSGCTSIYDQDKHTCRESIWTPFVVKGTGWKTIKSNCFNTSSRERLMRNSHPVANNVRPVSLLSTCWTVNEEATRHFYHTIRPTEASIERMLWFIRPSTAAFVRHIHAKLMLKDGGWWPIARRLSFSATMLPRVVCIALDLELPPSVQGLDRFEITRAMRYMMWRALTMSCYRRNETQELGGVWKELVESPVKGPWLHELT